MIIKYFWDTKIFLFFQFVFTSGLHTYFVCCCAKHQILLFCVQFFVASNDLDVLPRILQVELPALVPELVVVQGGEGGVAQAAEDPLRVVESIKLYPAFTPVFKYTL